MIHPVFLFGPLGHADFANAIFTDIHFGQGAVLQDFSACVVVPAIMPCLLPDPGATVTGVLIQPDAASRARLDLFLGVFGAVPIPVKVCVAGKMTTALAHVLPMNAPRSKIRPATPWTSDQAEIMYLATTEVMALADNLPKAALQARWPMALAHAASHLRARKSKDPAQLRRDWQRSDIELMQGRRPYAWYFAVAEDDVRFRKFDGGFSDVVKRAGFVMSDAVTVLPYDPVRDMVMVIEQFRFGPWVRGARNAWLLEPVAGRVDPFESPQDCALRETLEEARITLNPDHLFPVGHVYPSPGAITEFLYQFVALTDLPIEAEGVAGLDSEAEDIRSHIIAFDRLMELIASGEVVNGPLVQSAYWLALNRDRLRNDAPAQLGG